MTTIEKLRANIPHMKEWGQFAAVELCEQAAAELEALQRQPSPHPITGGEAVTTIEMVREFHRTFVTQPDEVIQRCRLALLREELRELEEAIEARDNVEILDALTDLQYVLDGTYIVFGLADLKDAAFREVHASNMSKLGADGKPIYREDGKVLKGPHYRPPNLNQFFVPA